MINLFEELSFKGYTFIVPSVGVGNIGQLTTDLLISSLRMKKVGTLWDPSIIPIIGPPAYKHDATLTTASDLYASFEKKLLVLQIRSPIVATLMSVLFGKLTNFLIREEISRLIIITGSFAHERHFVEGNSNQYLANEQFRRMYPNIIEKTTADLYKETQIPGGGFAVELYKTATSKNIATMVLFRYVSEGDNIPDATELMKNFNDQFSVLELRHGQLSFEHPVSWQHLFGNEPPSNIY